MSETTPAKLRLARLGRDVWSTAKKLTPALNLIIFGYLFWAFFTMHADPMPAPEKPCDYDYRFWHVMMTLFGFIAIVCTSIGVCLCVNRLSGREPRDEAE
jgi:hypothetical protein